MRFLPLLFVALGPVSGCGPSERSAPGGVVAAPARENERERMITTIEAYGVRDPLVLEALRRVPRHAFVPAGVREHAYEDRALPIGFEQTISQPAIVAMMTEGLALTKDAKVLEIGTGSGYQAAVLAEITPHVFTIEIVPQLAERARRALDACGYTSVQSRAGDGYRGWPEEAPFDAILITAATPEVPAPLVAQLATGGRLCVPVDQGAPGQGGSGVQELLVLTKGDDGTLSRSSLGGVRFVPMTGEVREGR
ncbi:MAG: protein-L-isoaspartate(D-aspartate) O-methyltransferase [bacterium]|nr:protein-L-isoaspartate(D-aspartate) O-methyltransferase [bacterium]